MKLSKSSWLLLSLMLVFALFLAACGNEADEPSTAQKDPVTTSDGESEGEEEEEVEETEDPATTNEPQSGGTLIMGSIGGPTLFNSIYSQDASSGDIQNLIFSSPVIANPNLEVEYDLATDIQSSEDGLTVTVTLRDDVRFHDGEPLTADDLVFTYSIPISDEYIGPRGGDFESIESITKIDDYTVEFKLNEVNVGFIPTTLNYQVLPEHILKDVPIAELGSHEFNTKNPIGSGPFIFDEWRDGEYVKVVRNDDYFLGAPYLEEIIYKIVPDQNALLAQLQAGDVDYYPSVPESEIDTVRGWADSAGVVIEEGLGLQYNFIAYNQQNEMFQDKRVRQALTHAVDREGIIAAVLNGGGQIAHVPESPLSWAYSDDVPVFEYDPEKAKQLLAEAGWEDTDGDGFLDKDGKKFAFEVKTNQGNKIREDITVILKQQLEEIGIEVTPNIMEFSAFVTSITAPNWDYDALILGWLLNTFPDLNEIYHSSQREQGMNFVWYSNPELDILLEEAKSLTDRDEYKDAYADIYKIVAEDQPYTFLYYPTRYQAIPSNLQDYTFHSRLDVYHPYKWWLKQE
ncbi:peptide-binding protein [Cytobacillus sp. IB215665]|uniref:peptide-binding protein n=1 Tax=Cytobacillus sp. IB215665 TaxID=3097357 RepID=UPI002A0CF9C6|nr:peptide-binding protein [Cytobacillus sp. IB215665]MDX8364540.1 peptide-binding protein [Cytobacillus sp. IB215665]